MRREALAAWLRASARALRGRGRLAARGALAAAWRAGRRRPEAVFAAAVVLGVAVMIVHWS